MKTFILCAAAYAALATVALAHPASRTTISRSGGNVTITHRPLYYDNGMRYVADDVPPNLCDDLGTRGFEVVSGPKQGCYRSMY